MGNKVIAEAGYDIVWAFDLHRWRGSLHAKLGTWAEIAGTIILSRKRTHRGDAERGIVVSFSYTAVGSIPVGAEASEAMATFVVVVVVDNGNGKVRSAVILEWVGEGDGNVAIVVWQLHEALGHKVVRVNSNPIVLTRVFGARGAG